MTDAKTILKCISDRQTIQFRSQDMVINSSAVAAIIDLCTLDKIAQGT
jgi:hypothetical protein